MVVVIDIIQEPGIDEIQGIDGLKGRVVHTLLCLRHVGLRGIQQDALLERLRPRHLHLDDELTPVVVPAAYVNDAVLLGLRPVGNLLRRPILNTLYTLISPQWEQGVKQTDDEVLVLAEYLLESQVGLRV